MIKLFVGNLPFSTSDSELIRIFSEFGEIHEAVVIRDRATGRSKGFGFVTFLEESAAEAALAANGACLMDRPLKIQRASGERRISRSFSG